MVLGDVGIKLVELRYQFSGVFSPYLSFIYFVFRILFCLFCYSIVFNIYLSGLFVRSVLYCSCILLFMCTVLFVYFTIHVYDTIHVYGTIHIYTSCNLRGNLPEFPYKWYQSRRFVLGLFVIFILNTII